MIHFLFRNENIVVLWIKPSRFLLQSFCPCLSKLVEDVKQKGFTLQSGLINLVQLHILQTFIFPVSSVFPWQSFNNRN